MCDCRRHSATYLLANTWSDNVGGAVFRIKDRDENVHRWISLATNSLSGQLMNLPR
jgi:hypothetical protein